MKTRMAPQSRTSLTVTEVAVRLGVNRYTVYNMLEEKKLRGYRLSDKPSSKWRIPVAEVERLERELGIAEEVAQSS